jgi:hypothetical protein
MRRRLFREPLTGQWEAATFKLRTTVIIATLLGPPTGMMFTAYDAAVTRYVARHVVQAQAFEAGLPQGQVVAAAGQIRAKPVQLPAGYPQFDNALMVIERRERYKRGKHGGWTPTGTQVWVSDIATLNGWTLDQRLIENARFDSYRASPCSQYDTRPGWVADCDKNYAYREGDDNLRYSYEVTPIPESTMMVIAAVSNGKLATIEHRLSAPPADLVLSTNGTPDVADWLDQRLKRQAAWSVFWAAVSLLVIWWHMYAALRRDEFRTVSRALDGGLWRAAVTMVPIAPIAWPFDGPGFMAAAWLGALVSVAIWFVLWLWARRL